MVGKRSMSTKHEILSCDLYDTFEVYVYLGVGPFFHRRAVGRITTPLSEKIT